MHLTSRSLILGVALSAACHHVASAQCKYEVTWVEPFDCGFWPDQQYAALGINNLGGWAGYRLGCFPSQTYLPVYCPADGVPQTLPMPPGAGDWGAQATDVNDAGVVIGFYLNGSIETGCIWWPDGTVVEIPPPPVPGWTQSYASDINASDVVVGTGPYVLADEVTTLIPAPRGFNHGVARAISDSGFVAGIFGNEGTTARAFRWKEGKMDLLDPLPGHPVSIAWDVNDSGEVVGSSRINTSPTAQVPTRWRVDGTPVALELLPGYTRGAAGHVNNHGVISGFLSAPGVGSLPVIWIDGTCHPVNDLTVSGSFPVGDIVDLNEAGQLASSWQVVLVSPVDSHLADLNGDCAVDGSDLVVVLSEWGPRDWSIADINTDGVVDGNDLAIVLGLWTGS